MRVTKNRDLRLPDFKVYTLGMEYQDDPESNLDFLRKLSKPEIEMYVRGYLLACSHIRESFTKGKINFLNSLLTTESSSTKEYLGHSIELLDSYEDLIKKKELHLKDIFPQSSPR